MAVARLKWISWLTILGPGTLVMLADTDAGSIVLSAQSGAVFGYDLLLLQFLLIPVLFMTQELALRLGLVTKMGLTELIKNYYGTYCAGLLIVTLIICCVGALITELSGLAAVGEFFHVPVWKTVIGITIFLSVLICTHSYFSIERIAILVGISEILFIGIAWCVHPDVHEIQQSLLHVPWQNTSYLYFIAGNIGAVIMPWMIFFQQSAVIDKGLTSEHLRHARIDTGIGVVLTQLVVCAVLILAAATVGKINPNVPMNTMKQLTDAIMPFLGSFYGPLLFSIGLASAAIVAAIVVSLTAAWSVGEMLGVKRSLQDHPQKAPWFYGAFLILLWFSALVIIIYDKELVNICVGIEVLNALLLPCVLLFLYLLSRSALPPEHALKGWYRWLVGGIFLLTGLLGMITGLYGFLHG